MGSIFEASKRVDNSDTAIFEEKMKAELNSWSVAYSTKYMDKMDAFLEDHQHIGLNVETTKIIIQMALMYGFEVGFNMHDVGGA